MLSGETTWRFIDSGAADGAFNMACDEAAARRFDLQVPLLRIFTWQPHTISLGFHQKKADLDRNKCKKNGVGIVRRPTGGRAIFHAEEITYSVIIPKTHDLFSKGTLGVYNEISSALVAGLNKLNLNLTLKKTQRADAYNNELACFATSALYEIHHEAKKIVGSAQRRFENALLQHGSILTGDKHLSLFDYFSKVSESEKRFATKLTKRTTSVSSVLGKNLPDKKIINAVKKGFEEHFGILLKDDYFLPHELEIINQLKPKYSN